MAEKKEKKGEMTIDAREMEAFENWANSGNRVDMSKRKMT
jgi:hypothetical protein